MMTAILIAVLVIVIVLGAVRPRWHMGLLAIVGCFVVAMIAPSIAGVTTAPLRFFPTELFLKLVGVTLFFVCLERIGTLEVVLNRVLSRIRHRPALVPLTFFVVPAALVTGGVSNLAVVALLAPLALRAASAVGIPALAMSVLVVGSANAAAFSPFSPAGVIVASALRDHHRVLGVTADAAFQWAFYLRTLVVQASVAATGFLLLGGWRAMRRAGAEAPQRPVLSSDDAIEPEDLLVRAPSSRNGAQQRSMVAFALFIVGVLGFGSSAAQAILPAGVCAVLGDPGNLGFIGAVAFMVRGDVALDEVVAHLPWSAIFLVAGMTSLIGLGESLGVLEALTDRLIAFASPASMPLWLALAAGALSSVSSSTGVVLPLFLPMLTEFHAHMPTLPVLTSLTSIGIGAHLVDASPLSTLGALFVASAGSADEQTKLFRALLLWGFVMIPVAALLCLALAFLPGW
jgi:di/tricarboxylate transporter